MAVTIFTNGQGNKQKKPVASVRKQGESRQGQKARMQGQQAPVQDNSDIDAIFRGINSTRGMVRRGYSGQALNPDGTDPGNSFDRFMRQNPHLGGAAQKQQQNDQIAKQNFQQKYSGGFLPGQSSPPGGASGARVGASQASGEPGGETTFSQLPAFQSEGMQQEVQYGPRQPVQQKGWESLFNVNKTTRMPPNAGPQYTPMMPNDGPQRPMDFGPQLPNSSAEQLMALKRLSGFGGNNNPTLTALEGTWSNIFPGVKDYEYLRQLFPGLVHPQAGAGQVMTELAKMYQNPAYQALFPNVNQSEFYR